VFPPSAVGALPWRGARPRPRLLNRQPKLLLAAGLRPRRPGGGLCRPLPLTCSEPRVTGQPWRERPRVLAASAITSAASAGRSRHGCLVCVEVRRFAFLRVDTTAKRGRFLPPFVALSVPESAGDALTLDRSWRQHAAHQTTYARQAVGRHIVRLDRETNETLFAYASSSASRLTTCSIK
jgi:hypothetical protein